MAEPSMSPGPQKIVKGNNSASSAKHPDSTMREAIASQPRLPFDIQAPRNDEQTLLFERATRAYNELRELIDLGNVRESAPFLHLQQCKRLIITDHLMAGLLSSGELEKALNIFSPPSDSGVQSHAFKVILHVPFLRDPHERADLVRIHALRFPPSASGAGSETFAVLESAKEIESLCEKHRRECWSELPGQEMTNAPTFKDVEHLYDAMVRSGQFQRNAHFTAISDLINSIRPQLRRHADMEAELFELACTAVKTDKTGNPLPLPASIDTYSKLREKTETALEEIDAAHQAAVSYKTISKGLVPNGSVSEMFKNAWRLLNTAIPLPWSRTAIAQESKKALRAQEDVMHQAMADYTHLPWPILPDESYIVLRAVFPQQDERSLSQARSLFRQYISTEVKNLSTNGLIYGSADRIAEVWCDIDRMRLRLHLVNDFDYGMRLIAKLDKFSRLMLEVNATNTFLEGTLRELRELLRKLDTPEGSQDLKLHLEALRCLSRVGRLRSSLLIQLRDAYGNLRELREADPDAKMGGIASTLDAISKFFCDMSECNFSAEGAMLRNLERTLNIIIKKGGAQNAELLQRIADRLAAYRKHLEDVQKGEAPRQLRASALVRFKDGAPDAEDPHAVYAKLKGALPPLLSQFLDFLDDRDSGHTAYRLISKKPYYARHLWLSATNLAEYLLLRIETDKLRGNSRMYLGTGPLLDWEQEIRGYFGKLTDINDAVMNALLAYSQEHGECPPLEAASLHASHFNRQTRVLRDEYPSRKHYGAVNEGFLHVFANVSESGNMLRIEINSAVISESGRTPSPDQAASSNIISTALPPLIIDTGQLLKSFNPERYLVKSPEDITLGETVNMDMERFRKITREVASGIPLRAELISNLRSKPADMLVTDLSRPRPLNGALVKMNGKVYSRPPQIVGEENGVELLSAELHGDFLASSEVLRVMQRTLEEEARAASYRAHITALHPELNSWFLRELMAIKKSQTPHTPSPY